MANIDKPVLTIIKRIVDNYHGETMGDTLGAKKITTMTINTPILGDVYWRLIFGSPSHL